MIAHSNAPASCWGATPEEWRQACNTFGAARLLPVVSNPEAPISPDSKMQAIGKTPSRYNANRQVVGIPKWTQIVATEAKVATWRREQDYGICIKTGRGLYGVDIDVDDAVAAFAYADALARALDLDHYVYRARENSGRLLLPLWIDQASEEPRLRSLTLSDGAVDLLGPGKQFVGYGTHPSGARYRWNVRVIRESERYAQLARYYDGSDLV